MATSLCQPWFHNTPKIIRIVSLTTYNYRNIFFIFIYYDDVDAGESFELFHWNVQFIFDALVSDGISFLLGDQSHCTV